MIGRCSKTSLKGENVILVEDEGVQARRDYLSKCLVMRFVGDRPLRWDEFRPWMAKAWEIPQESSFSSIGDDLWLLNVSSNAVALRIMALKRWKFKEWDILMDVWTETAGRSRCLEKSNEAWVVSEESRCTSARWSYSGRLENSVVDSSVLKTVYPYQPSD
ncbi:hypothetical protein LINPERPRIM_LOCUS37299 [Linum perenne]